MFTNRMKWNWVCFRFLDQIQSLTTYLNLCQRSCSFFQGVSISIHGQNSISISSNQRTCQAHTVNTTKCTSSTTSLTIMVWGLALSKHGNETSFILRCAQLHELWRSFNPKHLYKGRNFPLSISGFRGLNLVMDMSFQYREL